MNFCDEQLKLILRHCVEENWFVDRRIIQIGYKSTFKIYGRFQLDWHETTRSNEIYVAYSSRWPLCNARGLICLKLFIRWCWVRVTTSTWNLISNITDCETKSRKRSRSLSLLSTHSSDWNEYYRTIWIHNWWTMDFPTNVQRQNNWRLRLCPKPDWIL